MIIHNLWVRDFRNLHDHQINFSGKYNLELIGEGRLEVSLSDIQLPTNFWGDNINSVTGILGKNGVGKTNILELLTYVLYAPKSLRTDYFILMETGADELLLTANFKVEIHKQILDNITTLNFHPNGETDLKCAFLSNVVDGSKRYFPNGVIDISATKDLSPFPSNRSNILNEIRFFDKIDHQAYSFQYPHEVEIKFPRLNSSQFRQYQKLIPLKKKISDSKSRNTFAYWFIYFLLYDIIDESLKIKNRPEIMSGDRDAYINKLFHGVNFDAPLPHVRSIIKKILPSLEFSPERISSLSHLIELIGGISENSTPIHILEGKRQLRNDSFILPFNIHTRDILYAYFGFITQRGKINFSWHGISSGHKAFLNIFSKLWSIEKKIKNSNVLLLIDEGDLYFHPQWQKEYLHRLLKFLEEELSSSNFQLVLTSHSPFIASDIPISNLHLLYSNDDLSAKQDDEFQTFGANIHELYSKSFFISNGNIGSFANEKINQLISRIQKSTDKREKEKLLKFIGDSFLNKYLTKNCL